MDLSDKVIKVCGMRQPENIAAVESLGIDYMGFICYDKSPRAVKGVPTYLPTRCRRTGVFVNASVVEVCARAKELGLQAIQLHGHETPEYCEELQRALQGQQSCVELWKAFQISGPDDLEGCRHYSDTCSLFIFDTKCKTYGGSGEQFDWNVLRFYDAPTPFLLSGGIGPDSVEQLKQFHHPKCKGVDLNSLFEREPGMKNVEALEAFIKVMKTKD